MRHDTGFAHWGDGGSDGSCGRPDSPSHGLADTGDLRLSLQCCGPRHRCRTWTGHTAGLKMAARRRFAAPYPPCPDNENMNEIEQLKKQNADLLLALQQARNTALEEAAQVCDRASNRERGCEEAASAIRSMKDGTRAAGAGSGQVAGDPPAVAGTPDLPRDWQLVMDELGRATRKFPTWPTDPLHAVAILGEEFGELTKAVLQTVYEPHKVPEGELRTEAIQTAAMALRFLASLDRYGFARSAQHVQSSGTTESAVDGGGRA